MFDTAPIYDDLTSCTSSSYTPSNKTEVSRTGENRGKTCRVCKKIDLFFFFFFFSGAGWSYIQTELSVASLKPRD